MLDLPFEQGPIRPPSEARSLLVRVTRNCPWNRCEFCTVYKGATFSRRSVDEVKEDIERAAKFYGDYRYAFTTTFLQDADALQMPAPRLAEVIATLKERFPRVTRITAYGRGKTLAKRTVEDLRSLSEAGLSRIHMGLETGCDPLLAFMQKGATAEEMIAGGRKVKEAGISLCEYVILGLGGRRWWREHAVHTARALNSINPDFIRVRTLSVRSDTSLAEKVASGEFVRQTEEEVVREERLLIEHLEGITSAFVSDHMVNLLMDVQGRLPRDRGKMLEVIDGYLALTPEEKRNFSVGRRLGYYMGLSDFRQSRAGREKVEGIIAAIESQGVEVERAVHDLMEQMI